jgi:hypothetical protein
MGVQSSSRDGTTENHGLKSEVLYVSKLDWAKIISTAEEEKSGREEIALVVAARTRGQRRPSRRPESRHSEGVTFEHTDLIGARHSRG